MRNKLASRLAVVSLFVAASHVIAAPIANGGFERGNFEGWTNSGVYTAVVDESFGVNLARGHRAALLVGYSDFCGYGPDWPDPWSQSCPIWPPVPFANAPQGGPGVTYAFPGSVELDDAGLIPFRTETRLSQDITASAGDRLVFDWTWLSNDVGCPRQGTDAAFVLLRNSDSIIGVQAFEALCHSRPAPTSTAFGALGELGSMAITIPTSGLWTLHISVGNGFEDRYVASGLLVDNFRMEVPEPGSLAILTVGLAGLAASRRRKQ